MTTVHKKMPAYRKEAIALEGGRVDREEVWKRFHEALSHLFCASNVERLHQPASVPCKTCQDAIAPLGRAFAKVLKDAAFYDNTREHAAYRAIGYAVERLFDRGEEAAAQARELLGQSDE